MKGKILLFILLIMTFLGMTFLLNQKFKENVKKNQKEIESIEKKEEKKVKEEKKEIKNTYKDGYLDLVRKETGTSINDEVYQYISIDEEKKVNADFLLTKSGELYLGFPNYDDELPEKIIQKLEAFEFPNFVTISDEKKDYHIFIGEKIKDNINTIFLSKIDDDTRTIVIYITKNRHMGYIDLSDVSSGEINIIDLPFEDASYIIQSKSQEGYEVILVQRSGNRINITQNLMKK